MKKTPFYYVTKVCFASKKPWVKNFVNLPSAYFSAFSLQPIFMAIRFGYICTFSFGKSIR